MFKSLKTKLKDWVSKNEEEETSEENIKEEKVAKPKKEKVVKKTAEEKKIKKTKTAKIKAEAKEKAKSEKAEKTKEKSEARKKIKSEKKSKKDDGIEKLEEMVEDVQETIEEVEEQIEKVIENVEVTPESKKQKSSIFKKVLTEEKFNDMFEELEMILVTNNVAYEAVDKIKKYLSDKLIGKSLKEVDLTKELKNSIEDLLTNPPNFLETIKESLKEKTPYVILFSGINGAGKTTAIAKLVYYFQENKISSCVVAGDTFRAAAIQQLEVHANKLKVPIVKKDYGTDPAAVAFDGIAYAKKHKIDVVLIDTAGRLQNRDSLMKEIEKIARVAKADMKIFLGESITGNDATDQAKAFNEAINIDGIILSKADVDEKGGTAISVAAVTGKPILFLGTGQKYEDLEVFDKEKLIEKLGL